MPTPTLPIATLSTANTFRHWLERTNTVIDLINSNTVFISGYTSTGAFTINKDSGSSLNVANAVLVNNSVTLLQDNPITIGSNVVIGGPTTSAKSLTINANVTSILSPNGTFINASAVTLNASALTTYSNVYIANTSSEFTVNATTLFNSLTSFVNTVVFSGNTVYAKVVQVSGAGVANATVTTTTENDYSPVGLDVATVLQIQPTGGTLTLTGLAAPTTLSSNTGAKVLYLYNTGAFKITLKSANASSSLINQFKIGNDADYDILSGTSVALLYTSALKKWVPLSQPAATANVSSISVAGNADISGTLNVDGVSTFNANLIANTTTNTLYVNVVNNRVGIGRIPSFGFHVNTTAQFDTTVTFASTLTVGANVSINTSTYFVGTSSANTVVNQNGIVVANTSRSLTIEPGQMTTGASIVNASGFFGATAVVNGNATINNSVIIGNSLTTGTSGTTRFLRSGGDSYLQFGLNGSDNSSANLIFTTINANTEWMRIVGSGSGNGNIGIGTQTPLTRLDVNGIVRAQSNVHIGTTANVQINGTGAVTIANTSTTIVRDMFGIAPTGTILMWVGTKATVPTGWVLCDGSSYSTTGTYANLYAVIQNFYGGSGGNFNVPNLQQRFPMGAGETSGTLPFPSGDTPTLNATGGVQSHSHTITVNSGGAHQHTVSGTTDSAGSHSHTITVDAVSGHTHDYNFTTGTQTDGLTTLASLGTGGYLLKEHTHDGSGTTTSAGHSHTASSSTEGSHSHTFSTTAASAGAHNHTASSSTVDYTNGGLPPYIALHFIIKA